MVFRPPLATSVGRVEELPADGTLLLSDPFKPDPLLPDEFFKSFGSEELSYGDLQQLDRLEDLYQRWLGAKSINARSAAMHRAVLEFQPRIADAWIPIWRSRRADAARRRFRNTLQMISMLRERGFGYLFGDTGLITAIEGRANEGDAPAPQAPPRRCEGRSRAPGAAGGGSRRGGSRRGGGDRGDDSGGDGGSDSGGDGSGGGASPEPRAWRYLKRAAVVATIAGALYPPASNLIERSSDDRPVHKTVIVKKVIVRESGARGSATRGSGKGPSKRRPGPPGESVGSR